MRERPLDTLDRICGFLGVRTGETGALPAENITTHASRSVLNNALGRVLRKHARARPHLPGCLGDLLAAPAQKLLQREQRRRAPLPSTERAALLPAFTTDIGVVERVTGLALDHWRDPHRRPSERHVSPPAASARRVRSITPPRAAECGPARVVISGDS